MLMGALRDRSSIIAALLLATLAFAGAGVGHRHDSLAAATGHEDLPIFSVGHEQPDRTLHIEGEARLEAASCVGCLQRQRERAAAMPPPVFGGFEPGSSASVTASVWRPAAKARRLKPSRAPPQA